MGRSKTARLDLATTPELRARMEAEADRLGQSLTVFVTRALEAALVGTPDAPVAPGRDPNQTIPGPSVPMPNGERGGKQYIPPAPAAPRAPARETPAMARQRKLNDAKSKPPKKVKT